MPDNLEVSEVNGFEKHVPKAHMIHSRPSLSRLSGEWWQRSSEIQLVAKIKDQTGVTICECVSGASSFVNVN